MTASLRTVDLVLPAEHAEDFSTQQKAVARALHVPVTDIGGIRLLKHSIDARQKRIKAHVRLEIALGGPLPPIESFHWTAPPLADNSPRVIIVGCGPAGMFAALRCLEHGVRPILLERGKDASSRRFDLAPLLRQGRVIEDSNYCFGEGGAGTFSDGKLYTRASKRGSVHQVYQWLVAHGAPERILVDAHPHIGSNLLPNVVMALRRRIIECGGEVHFGQRVTELLRDASGIQGVVSADGTTWQGSGVILATGHSARDIYRLLLKEGLELQQKAFAVGVRIEHRQSYIDQWQYHLSAVDPRPYHLPAARYALATKIRDRGVHTFCMCPGGFIVPAATENDEVVVNGMSLSRRDSPFANSGLVVTVEPEDTQPWFNEHGVLAGVAFQKDLELMASRLGGGKQKAPGQRVHDFLHQVESSSLPETSYFPGITPAPLHEVLPSFIAQRMAEGLRQFSRSMPGYLDGEANLIGFETRTSSPVRIPRHPGSMQHPDCPGLFPCGEGAGFAGGIVSAALDGLKVADALAQHVCAVR